MTPNRVLMVDLVGTQANATAIKVDGSAVTQPVSGTVTVTDGAGALNVIVDSITAGDNNIGNVDVLTLPNVTIGTFPDNEPFNVAQVGGNATATGNGTTTTGTQRVTLASDSTGQVAIASLPNEGQQTAANSISVTPDTDNDAIGATGAAPPGEAAFIGGLSSGATGGFLQGIAVCDSFVNVNVSTATTTLLVTGVSGRHVRICSLSLVTAAANNVALISGTGATCGTGTTGMNGGTTAAAGWNFAANGGLTQGSGIGAINQTNATGDSVCAVTSAATQLSGRISYTIY
jgi:hypothetical protein